MSQLSMLAAQLYIEIFVNATPVFGRSRCDMRGVPFLALDHQVLTLPFIFTLLGSSHCS